MIYRRVLGVPSFGFRDTFDELDRMRRQMDRLFNDLGAVQSLGAGAGVFPLVNITEDKESYYIRAELPGVKGGDLDIQATVNTLSISGERKFAEQAKGAKYHRREREAGKFSRVIGLPGDIDADKVSAELVNGILTLSVPKAEAAKPKQISIK